VQPMASVIVRTYNSAATLSGAIESIRNQDVPVQLVIVDSGSRDATVELASPHADVLIAIPPDEFTFGRALNQGSAASTAPVVIALSSHCAFPRADWVRRCCAHVSAGASAVVGTRIDGEGRPLAQPFSADHAYLTSHRHWGMSNHASAWSRSVWESHAFDERLTASEDKEWTWRALAEGGALVADPALCVAGAHRRAAGVRAYFHRLVKEMRAVESLRPVQPYSMVSALRDWTSAHPQNPRLTRTRRCGRARLTAIAAQWWAARQGERSTAAGSG